MQLQVVPNPYVVQWSKNRTNDYIVDNITITLNHYKQDTRINTHCFKIVDNFVLFFLSIDYVNKVIGSKESITTN